MKEADHNYQKTETPCRQTNRHKFITTAAVVSLLILAIVPVYGLFNVVKFWWYDPVRLQSQPCKLENDELFCINYYADDGKIRLTVRRDENNNCCQIKRSVASVYGPNKEIRNTISYDVTVCTVNEQKFVDCSKFEEIISRYGGIAIIDHQYLSPLGEHINGIY